MALESFADLPLQTIIKAYLYLEYSDDADLQAFFRAYNSLAQEYLDWFNDTPLGVYTSPYIFGPLLDWIAQGIYGVSRPVISTQSTSFVAGATAFPITFASITGYKYTQSGTAQVASDDIFKRALTWILYRGDGMQMSIFWMQKRVARFLYGQGGNDISLDDIEAVSVVPALYPFRGAMGMLPMGLHPMGMGVTTPGYRPRSISIAVQASHESQVLADLIASNVLPTPFQTKIFVTVGVSALIGSTFVVGISEVG